jgi:glutamate-1-semialdehyde 2,1-aminomutase
MLILLLVIMANGQVEAVSRLCARSIELHQHASQYLAGGVSSNFRSGEKPALLFFESASGARLRSVDGVEYIDYALGMGP